MNWLILLTIISTSIPLLVYSIYIIGAITAKNDRTQMSQEWPPVSIVIPAYNEENFIAKRLQNLADAYPMDKMEIIVSNDGSTDATESETEKTFEKYSLNGILITEQRSGVNTAINRGIEKSSHEIVIITGADGLFDNDTIPNLVSKLVSEDKIGAVSGDMIPLAKEDTLFAKSESSYRSIYGKICNWESNVDSTYCFNGAVVAFKKKAASTLNKRRGADDASMALSVIKNGYKCKYVPDAKFYEYVPHDFKEQRKQKIRRATRLLEATLFNHEVCTPKNGKFGMIIYPLRVLMFAVVPTMTFLAIACWAILLGSFNVFYGFIFLGFVAIIILTGKIKENLVSSFIIYQSYLLLGLFNIFRDVHIWEPNKRD